MKENLWDSLVRFGGRLIDTLDLDPVYVALHAAELEPKLLHRWLLAYWCCYHAGVASRVAEAKDFHGEMKKFQDEKWPRGKERRHFRGGASAKALRWLAKEYPKAEDAVGSLKGASTFPEVRERISRWPLFGPWIAFKAADMLERVCGWGVEFNYDDLGIYKEPAAAAAIVRPGVPLADTVADLVEAISGRPAPPGLDRPCGIQEAETCLCKWKSWRNGHYKIRQDCAEMLEALKGWGPLGVRIRTSLVNRLKRATT